VTQLLDTLLAPDIQEQILFAESADGLEPMFERMVRGAVSVENWAKQREGVLSCSADSTNPLIFITLPRGHDQG
jgi:hypothetical protein